VPLLSVSHVYTISVLMCGCRYYDLPDGMYQGGAQLVLCWVCHMLICSGVHVPSGPTSTYLCLLGGGAVRLARHTHLSFFLHLSRTPVEYHRRKCNVIHSWCVCVSAGTMIYQTSPCTTATNHPWTLPAATASTHTGQPMQHYTPTGSRGLGWTGGVDR
jgi:hypothetical protein